MKKVTISSQIFVVFLFLLIFLFCSRGSNKNLAINNNNFNKMADTVSILFEEEENSKIVDESIVLPLVDEKEEEETIEEEEVIDNTNEVSSEEPVNNIVSLEPDILDTVVGNLTGYGANCYGCSGTTTSGFDLTKSIYYEDEEYGTIRIVAADPSFPLYSIFRISNVPNMEPFIVIVLDRGGNVGFGRGTLFDLAYFDEGDPNLIGLTHNVTFELLRRGK